MAAGAGTVKKVGGKDLYQPFFRYMGGLIKERE
jgi:hypothetical protein